MGRYVLAHGGAELERRRLQLLDRFHGPLTVEQISAAGVGPGWRCLDVGAGSGAMTRRLAERVAPGGRVVAVDRETHWLEPLTSEIVEVRRADITTTPLPGGFDLVLAQMLLLHLPDPARACQDLLAAAAPGGQIVVHDVDFTPCGLEGATHEEAAGVGAMTAVMRAAGVDLALGPKLADLFDAAGARIEDVRSEPAHERGGDTGALIAALTLERFRDQADVEVDAAITALRDPRRVFIGPTRWVVRCRRASPTSP